MNDIIFFLSQFKEFPLNNKHVKTYQYPCCLNVPITLCKIIVVVILDLR